MYVMLLPGCTAAEVEDCGTARAISDYSPYSLQAVNSTNNCTKNEIHRETMPLKVVLDKVEDLLKKKINTVEPGDIGICF